LSPIRTTPADQRTRESKASQLHWLETGTITRSHLSFEIEMLQPV